MSRSQPFNQIVREWAEVFMRRSMRDFIVFAKNSGLSMPQLSAMIRLYHQGACGVSEIGNHLGVTNAAASQLVERLVQQGLLDRAEDSHDRRVKQVSLSTKGRALLQKGIDARYRWLEDLVTQLTPEQQESVVTALGHLTEAVRKVEESPTR